jgi:hypothetical protein
MDRSPEETIMLHLLKIMIDSLRNALNKINDTVTRAAIAKPAQHRVTGTQITAGGEELGPDALYQHMQARQARLQKRADTDRLVAQARQNLLREVQNEIAASVAQLNEKNRQIHHHHNAAENDAEDAEKVVWMKYIVALDRQESRMEETFGRQVDAAARQDYPDMDGFTRRVTELDYNMPVPFPEDLVCEN